jgi:hypothetical protein
MVWCLVKHRDNFTFLPSPLWLIHYTIHFSHCPLSDIFMICTTVWELILLLYLGDCFSLYWCMFHFKSSIGTSDRNWELPSTRLLISAAKVNGRAIYSCLKIKLRSCVAVLLGTRHVFYCDNRDMQLWYTMHEEQPLILEDFQNLCSRRANVRVVSLHHQGQTIAGVERLIRLVKLIEMRYLKFCAPHSSWCSFSSNTDYYCKSNRTM